MQGRKAIAAVLAVSGVFGSVAWVATQSPYVFISPDRPYEMRTTRQAYDMSRLFTPSALSDVALSGRTLWVQRCAVCHESGTALGPWLDSSALGRIGEARARAKIADGSQQMPGFKYALTSAQIDQVVAFLKTVPADEKRLKRESLDSEGGR